MDEQTNLFANISLGSAIGLIVLFVVSFCIGFIPFVSLLNLLILPLEVVVALVGIVTGVVGLVQAANLGGAGRAQAIVGIVVPILWGLLYAALMAFGMGVVFLAILMDSM